MIFVWAYLGISAVASIVLLAACAMAKRADNLFLDEESYTPVTSMRGTTPTTTSRPPVTGQPLSDATQAASAG